MTKDDVEKLLSRIVKTAQELGADVSDEEFKNVAAKISVSASLKAKTK